MPSFLQTAKQKVVGVGRIPEDSVDFDLLNEFKTVVLVIERTILKFEEKIRFSANLHEEFLQISTSTHLKDRLSRIPRTCDSMCSNRLGPIKMRISSILNRIENFEIGLKKRDEAYFMKSYYIQKIANLPEKDKLDFARVDRNIKKQADAVTKFAESETIVAQVGDFLKNRFASLNAIMELYVRFLGDYHDTLAEEIDN